MSIDWQNFFTKEEFEQQTIFGCDSAEHCVEFANQKLWLHIQTAERGFGNLKLGHYHGIPTTWNIDHAEDCTHSCGIIDIRKLDSKKET